MSNTVIVTVVVLAYFGSGCGKPATENRIAEYAGLWNCTLEVSSKQPGFELPPPGVVAPSTSLYIDKNGKGYFYMEIVKGNWTLRGDVLEFRPDKPSALMSYIADQGRPKEWIEFQIVGKNEITLFIPMATGAGRRLTERGHVLHFKRFSLRQ